MKTHLENPCNTYTIGFACVLSGYTIINFENFTIPCKYYTKYVKSHFMLQSVWYHCWHSLFTATAASHRGLDEGHVKEWECAREFRQPVPVHHQPRDDTAALTSLKSNLPALRSSDLYY